MLQRSSQPRRTARPLSPVFCALFHSEESHCRLMSAAIAGDEDAAVRGKIERRALPIGGNAPCALDNRNHRAEIVGLEAGFKDEVDEAGRKQTIGVAVRPKARQLDGIRDPRKSRVVTALKHIGGGGKKGGSSQRGTRPAVDRCAVQGRGPPRDAYPALARDRLIDNPKNRTLGTCQRYQCPEQRDAADKRFRSVDRIQRPDEFSILALP